MFVSKNRLLSSFTRCVRGISSGIPDKQLQISFEGLVPKILSLQILRNKSEQQKFADLSNKGVLPPHFHGLMLFSCLQNPLLIKYNFDPSDFLLGAKEAYIQINKAIASKDFANFANGYLNESPSNTLLKESLSPKFYAACLKTSKAFNNAKTQVIMTDVKVLRIMMDAVETTIIDSDTIESLETDVPDQIQTPVYPKDSVIATVDVFFEAEESYESTIHLETEKEPVLTKSSRINKSRFTFQGCISGQIELDWKVVTFE